jgi:hypothetical protein
MKVLRESLHLQLKPKGRQKAPREPARSPGFKERVRLSGYLSARSTGVKVAWLLAPLLFLADAQNASYQTPSELKSA